MRVGTTNSHYAQQHRPIYPYQLCFLYHGPHIILQIANHDMEEHENVWIRLLQVNRNRQYRIYRIKNTPSLADLTAQL